MSRVDFYILPDDSRHNLQQFACRLTEKAYQQGHRILIKTDNADESRILDNLLWTFNDDTFIPHAVTGSSDNNEQPVLISHLKEPENNFQLLINLSSSTDNEKQFERIAEILNQEATRKQVGRQHYKIYRDLGFELHHHEMN